MGIKKKIKRTAFNIAKKNVVLRKYARKAQKRFRTRRYCSDRDKYPTNPKLVYFNTFNGRSYSDSPKAIYECLIKSDKFKDYRFVWTFKNPEEYEFLLDDPRTSLIKFNTEAERTLMKQAKYWIANYRLLDHLMPKDDQIYLQCWHGTPLKRLGYDLVEGGNVMNTKSEIEDKYKTDAERFRYILSPSRFASEKFSTAWNLKEFGTDDTMIEEGYPRNDRLVNAGPEEIAELKKSLGIDDIGNKKVILYAPTWRDNQHASGVGYVYHSDVDYDYLQQQLAEDYIILFRAHYLVANSFDFEKYKGFIYDVSGYDDINDLYLASDMLMTDYSSAFFDYALLKKPIVFYMYDKKDYADNIRGFYLDLDELPGCIVENEKDVIDVIHSVSENWQIDEKYKAFNDKFNYLDDGHATERVVKKVFGIDPVE